MFSRRVFIAVLVIASSLLFFSCDTAKAEIAKASYIEFEGVRYSVADAIFSDGTLQNSSTPGESYIPWNVFISTDGLEYSDAWTGTGSLLFLRFARSVDTYSENYVDIDTYLATRSAIAYDPGMITSAEFVLDYGGSSQSSRAMIPDSGNSITVAESGGVFTVNITILCQDDIGTGSSMLKGFFTGTIDEYAL